MSARVRADDEGAAACRDARPGRPRLRDRAGAPLRASVVVLACLCRIALAASPAHAQDFERGGEAGAASGPAAFIAGARPPADGFASAEALGLSRFGLPEISTQAIAAGGGWHSLRAAAGFSQTGDAEIGWSAWGAALGVASSRWGAGVSGIARRDRTPRAGLPWWGYECGMGLWVRAAPRVVAWASAPQLWSDGAAPPLERGLAVGVRAEGDGLYAWFEHETRPDAAAAVTHRGGVALVEGPFEVRAEGLDAPLRAALGVRARAAFVTACARVESHPLLGETVTVALAIGRAPRARAVP